MDKGKKAIWGWALYDWANSAFATTVMAGFFPVFFKQFYSAGADATLTTARLGLANSAAALLVALAAPLMGAVADVAGRRKGFLVVFTYLGAASCLGLTFLEKGQWAAAALVYAAGVVGFSGGNVFYDSLLPFAAKGQSLDRVSSLGYALGYLGGGLLFLLNALMSLFPSAFGLADAAQAVKVSFLMVGLWWGGFALFTFAWAPEGDHNGPLSGPMAALRQGLSRVRETIVEGRRHRQAFMFLLAYWCYIDGVDTLIRMAVDYGLSIGFATGDLIAALLVVQFVGLPAALVMGRLGQAWGVRRTLFLCIGSYAAITVWGALMTAKWEFYVLAVGMGLVQGGIQALSRSYYARLIPAHKSAQFFGFYNMLGKFAVIAGPLLMGGVGLLVRWAILPEGANEAAAAEAGKLASRAGMMSLLLLFGAGAWLLSRVGRQKS